MGGGRLMLTGPGVVAQQNSFMPQQPQQFGGGQAQMFGGQLTQPQLTVGGLATLCMQLLICRCLELSSLDRQDIENLFRLSSLCPTLLFYLAQSVPGRTHLRPALRSVYRVAVQADVSAGRYPQRRHDRKDY